MKERRNCAGESRCKCGHVELVMHDGGENDQHDADSNSDERERNNWELDYAKCAAEDQQPSDDGGDAGRMPPDRATKQGRPPRKYNVAKGLVTDADKRDERRAT